MRFINNTALVVLALCTYACIKPKACKQNQVCDNAVITLVNQTNDTVLFGVGKSYFDDTLVPGANKNFTGGPVDIRYKGRHCTENLKTWATWEIESSYGAWAFDVNHCSKVITFRYDDNTQTSVSLYDTSGE